MFDAFAKIDGCLDGPAEGRGASDNKRIELAEWMKGFPTVAEHGFVALAGLKSPEDAKAVFSQMDDNGGGVVLLDEWCAYLKSIEDVCRTPIGILLSASEGGGLTPEQIRCVRSTHSPTHLSIHHRNSENASLSAMIALLCIHAAYCFAGRKSLKL